VVMKAMLQDVAPRLRRGAVMRTATVTAPIPEGIIAAALAQLQRESPDVAIGSYPYYHDNGSHGVQLVARCRNPQALETAAAAFERIFRAAGAQPKRI
jgi:molybdopterin-biosynthesis enzyme MoeA-like protein